MSNQRVDSDLVEFRARERQDHLTFVALLIER